MRPMRESRDAARKRGLKKMLLIVSLILMGVSAGLIKLISPYGEKYLPQWVQVGNVIVESIEHYKDRTGHYPEDLPFEPNLMVIPGCRDILYHRGRDEDGREYFSIRMDIHMREAVFYDSRRNLNESLSLGKYAILDDWMWTEEE